MNIRSELSQDDVIHSWHIRANAYDKLIKRWPIFTNMVDRLLNYIPKDFDGHALDIGGGSGLLAERLLQRNPNAIVTLVDPARNMRTLASRRLGDRINIKSFTSDNLNKLDLVADAAFCSASFHLMNEATTLPSIASVLNKDSILAINLWGHSFNETLELDRKLDWMEFVDQALYEHNQKLMRRPIKATRRIKSVERLRKIGDICGLRLIETKIVTAEIESKFNIEFAAMDLNFLNYIETSIRKQVIDLALKLCCGFDTISVVDLHFKKV